MFFESKTRTFNIVEDTRLKQ